MSEAWKKNPEVIVENSFKRCCVSDALKGRKGTIVRKNIAKLSVKEPGRFSVSVIVFFCWSTGQMQRFSLLV